MVFEMRRGACYRADYGKCITHVIRWLGKLRLMSAFTPVEGRLIKAGNSTAVTLPRPVLETAGLTVGDTVRIIAEAGRVTIDRVNSAHEEDMAAVRHFNARYRRAMAALAK